MMIQILRQWKLIFKKEEKEELETKKKQNNLKNKEIMHLKKDAIKLQLNTIVMH